MRATNQGLFATALDTGIVVAPDGRIWVQRHIPGPESDPIDIMRIDGEYIGTLSKREPFPVAVAGDDRLVELVHDSLDVPVIRMYRVHHGGVREPT